MSIRSRRAVKGEQDPNCLIEIIVMVVLVLATLVLAFPMG
jgi:hypothetical protein